MEKLVTLRGNTHPLARPEYDQGAAPDSLPMERMLLVLQRSAEQEAALRKLLDEQQIKSSPNYHMWLTPEQFGQQFGPADADIQAVTDWLASQGFQVSRVAAGRTVIEFSGTAGQVRQAFHTEIHKFVVNGEEHWANASDPQIPAALDAGGGRLCLAEQFPQAADDPPPGRLFTVKSHRRGEATLHLYPDQRRDLLCLGPADFATIYNVCRSGMQRIDGTGQTIAIVAEIEHQYPGRGDFRTMFGLPANDPQIILNGPDPGISIPRETRVKPTWTSSGPARSRRAPPLTLWSQNQPRPLQGVDLSALYIIDNNLAPVMSESYGACEAYLGDWRQCLLQHSLGAGRRSGHHYTYRCGRHRLRRM